MLSPQSCRNYLATPLLSYFPINPFSGLVCLEIKPRPYVFPKANNAVCIQRLVHANRNRQIVKKGGGRKIFQVNQMETSLVELRAVRWRPAAPFGAVPRRISVRVAIPQTKEARQKSLMQIHKIPVNLSTADVATIAELAIKWR